MSKSIWVIGSLIVIGFLTWFALSGSPDRQDGAGGITAAKLPNLSFSDYSGKTIALADFAGMPLVINSWAAWCPFCKKELEDFVTVQKELGEKVIFIAIDRAESLGTAKNFTDQYGITDDLVFLLDSRDSFYQAIGGFTMPETVFVDKNGNIADHKRGPMEVKEIRERAQKILN